MSRNTNVKYIDDVIVAWKHGTWLIHMSALPYGNKVDTMRKLYKINDLNSVYNFIDDFVNLNNLSHYEYIQ